jgi:hypothetical protein
MNSLSVVKSWETLPRWLRGLVVVTCIIGLLTGSVIWPGLFFLILIVGLLIFFRQSSLGWQRQNMSQRNLADLRIRQLIDQHQQVIVKTYNGSQAEATKRFVDDSTEMAAHGYFPTSQSWAPGQWAARAFIIAVLLIFLFGLGLLILGYMLIVKPDGTLTATFERRTAIEEKTCPRCAERIKAAALVCHFCGHEFAPGEVKKVEEQGPE